MVSLTPFMFTPWYEGAKPYLVYSVDCDKPETTNGYFQGYFTCTHCGVGNQFRFYNDSYHPKYITRCPNVDCNELFIVEDDTDYED